jgi:hypothetical protein
MDAKLLLAAAAVVAVVGGGIYWFDREARIQECRRAAVSAAQVDASFGNADVDAALAIARQMDRDKVAECYQSGLIATPIG